MQLLDNRPTAGPSEEEHETKAELSPEEVQKWMREFGL